MSTLTCDGELSATESPRQRSISVKSMSVRDGLRPDAGGPFLRPRAEDLNETIPVFFIGRNARGHWVARGADGKSGGLFWRKQAAIGFASRSAWPERCATVFPAGTIELDLENRGNPLLAHIDVTRMLRNAGAAIHIVLLTAVLAGAIALKAGIFLSRLKY